MSSWRRRAAAGYTVIPTRSLGICLAGTRRSVATLVVVVTGQPGRSVGRSRSKNKRVGVGRVTGSTDPRFTNIIKKQGARAELEPTGTSASSLPPIDHLHLTSSRSPSFRMPLSCPGWKSEGGVKTSGSAFRPPGSVSVCCGCVEGAPAAAATRRCVDGGVLLLRRLSVASLRLPPPPPPPDQSMLADRSRSSRPCIPFVSPSPSSCHESGRAPEQRSRLSVSVLFVCPSCGGAWSGMDSVESNEASIEPTNPPSRRRTAIDRWCSFD